MPLSYTLILADILSNGINELFLMFQWPRCRVFHRVHGRRPARGGQLLPCLEVLDPSTRCQDWLASVTTIQGVPIRRTLPTLSVWGMASSGMTVALARLICLKLNCTETAEMGLPTIRYTVAPGTSVPTKLLAQGLTGLKMQVLPRHVLGHPNIHLETDI